MFQMTIVLLLMLDKPFKIASYNCSGLNCCSDFIRDILETNHYDFLSPGDMAVRNELR